MYILLVNLINDLIQFDIYKIYRTKKIVHELEIKIIGINEKTTRFLISNSSNALLFDKSINFKSNQSIEDKVNTVFQHEKLVKYEFTYIVNKIKDGGAQYTDITLFHSRTVANLAKINHSTEQKLQLRIAEHLHVFYKKAKHYLCFDTGFYSTINNNLQTDIGFPVSRDTGLFLSGISSKLPQYTTKAKKNWLIVIIEPQYTILCVIKKLECISNSKIKLNVFDNGHENLNRLNCLKISKALAEVLTTVDEIHGIIISGSLGITNGKIRKAIFKPLTWSGIVLNTKSTNYLISKKSSTLPVKCINSSETEAILNQLISRL